jgi:hypothetical protein
MLARKRMTGPNFSSPAGTRWRFWPPNPRPAKLTSAWCSSSLRRFLRGDGFPVRHKIGVPPRRSPFHRAALHGTFGSLRPGRRREYDDGRAAGGEIGPIPGHVDASAGIPHHGGNKAVRCGVDFDPLVGQPPVHLLDRVLGRKAARRGAALAGRLDRKAKRSR